MFFYNFEMLDNFIKSDFISSLKAEQENIKQIANLYTNKKINVLSTATNIIELGDLIDKSQSENFYETVSLLKKLFENINTIQELTTKLDKDLTETIALYDKGIENNFDEIKANLVEYNKQRDDLANKMYEFETVHTTVLSTVIALSVSVSNKKFKKKITPLKASSKKDETKIDIELEPYDNNTLIVSEKEQKAYLPFFYSEVKKIYENSNNRYQTLQDVVNDLYIVPLDKFKNSATARFRESFRLIREKQHGSITKAIDLGLELMFKYALNPVIISACRNLDELDIYLDCLETREIHEFSCFKIKFEMMPQLLKGKKGLANSF